MPYNLKSKNSIRKYHYFLLLSLIQKRKQISRAQLAKITHISNTSVGKIVKELIEDNLVIEVGKLKGVVGKSATLLEVNPKGSYVIGINIDLNSAQIAVVTLNGEVIEQRNIDCDMKQKAENVLDQIAFNTLDIINRADPKVVEKIIAVGVSIPGPITWPDGEVLMVPQFHWKNVKVRAYLEQKLDFAVYVDNDVRTVLLAESLFGSMKGYGNSVCLYIGSGVGSAVMINGEILRGHRNTLGEIGHITLDPHGAMCDCGRLGCLQTFICSSELEKQMQISIQEIYKAYHQGDHSAIRMIKRARDYLGIAISNIISMYNPEAILLAGPMIQQFPDLVDGIEDVSNEYVWYPLKDSFKIIQAKIGENSGAIGASALVLNEYLRPTFV